MKSPFDLLDKFYLDLDKSQPYEIIDLPARELINSKRFDFFSILIYIDHRVKGLDMSFATNLYKERVAAVTDGSFIEIGKSESKNTFNKFTNTLDKLIVDFQKDNFDNDQSLIPIDADNVVLDGAHRVCCAVYFNRKIRVMKLSGLSTGLQIDYNWLLNRSVSQKNLKRYALEYCTYGKNLYLFVLWPKSSSNKKDKSRALELIENSCNVVFTSKIDLPYNAIRNLMIQIYGHMNWVGSVEDDFEYTYAKASDVYQKNKPTEFILVEGSDLTKVTNLKSEIRNVFDIGLNSVHSTDNPSETLQLANLIYNENSTHHLLSANPCKYKNSFKLTEKFKSIIVLNNKKLNDFIVCGSSPLAIYGIRDSDDLDYISIHGNKMDYLFDNCQKIENHENYKNLFSLNFQDIICNPDNYFIFNDIKFISLETLKSFKKVRGEKKDINDIKLMTGFQNKNIFYKYHQFLNFTRVVSFKLYHGSWEKIYYLVSLIPEPIKSIIKWIIKK